MVVGGLFKVFIWFELEWVFLFGLGVFLLVLVFGIFLWRDDFVFVLLSLRVLLILLCFFLLICNLVLVDCLVFLWFFVIIEVCLFNVEICKLGLRVLLLMVFFWVFIFLIFLYVCFWGCFLFELIFLFFIEVLVLGSILVFVDDMEDGVVLVCWIVFRIVVMLILNV